MTPITTPDSIDFIKIDMNKSWMEANPPKEYPNFKSFVSISSKNTPRIIIITQKQRLSLDFKIASQIYIDGKTLRYNKTSLEKMKVDELTSQ